MLRFGLLSSLAPVLVLGGCMVPVDWNSADQISGCPECLGSEGFAPENAAASFNCFLAGDCDEGSVCGQEGSCLEVVSSCPLTEECLADPTAWEPERSESLGVDPWYAGDLVTEELEGRLEVELWFQEDHLYGEGLLITRGPQTLGRTHFIITGQRDGQELVGQLIDRDHILRYDLTFSARMLSSSELFGEVSVVSQLGETTGSIQLLRLSPCGCDPALVCASEAAPGCPSGEGEQTPTEVIRSQVGPAPDHSFEGATLPSATTRQRLGAVGASLLTE